MSEREGGRVGWGELALKRITLISRIVHGTRG
jgi:hypothetical protein